MANPVYEDGALPRRKKPAEDLTGKDSVLPTQEFGIHKATPPTLADGDVCPPLTDDMGNKMVTLGDPAQVAALTANKLIPYNYDYISLNTPSQPTVITFKTGGSGGTTVATLTLTYSGEDIATVTRT